MTHYTPFKIDRTPGVGFSNVPANTPLDPYGRDVSYLSDPQGWVRDSFAQAQDCGAKMIRFIKPDGHLLSLPDGLYRAGVFREQEANNALCEECRRFTDRGGKVALYTGRVRPDGVAMMDGDPFLETFRPLIDAGLYRLDFDNTSSEDQAQQNSLSTWAWRNGLLSGGEAYCLTWLSNGQVIMKSDPLHKHPWIIMSSTMRLWDPKGLWRVKPTMSEMRIFLDARLGDPRHGLFGSVDECIAFVKDRQDAGFIFETYGVRYVESLVLETVLRRVA